VGEAEAFHPDVTGPRACLWPVSVVRDARMVFRTLLNSNVRHEEMTPMALNDALRKLYLVDQQVRGLESRVAGARRHAESQKNKLKQLENEMEQLTSQLHHAQASAANLENEIASIDERIEKLRQQMNAVRTNKEYSAMLVEVNTLKADRAKVEDRALEVMGEVESLKEQVAAKEAEIAEQRKVTELSERDLEQRYGEVAERLEQLKAERAEAAAEVPPTELNVFDRLAESFEGEAMAPIIEQDRRRLEYVCGGCYMQIPVEKVNQLISADEMVRCPSCKRILYLEPELKEEMGVK
jgi:hypothetical protein